MSTFVSFETFARVACAADPIIEKMYDVPMLYAFTQEICQWLDANCFPGYIAQYVSEDTYATALENPNNAIMGATMMTRLDREQTAEVFRRFAGIADCLINETLRENTSKFLVLASEELLEDDQKWDEYVSLMQDLLVDTAQ